MVSIFRLQLLCFISVPAYYFLLLGHVYPYTWARKVTMVAIRPTLQTFAVLVQNKAGLARRARPRVPAIASRAVRHVARFAPGRPASAAAAPAAAAAASRSLRARDGKQQ